MESLQFQFQNGTRRIDAPEQLAGVVSSGNLEILLETVAGHDDCDILVNTAAHGFGTIWQAVLADFHQRWSLRGARIAINDMGATPAVVSLRLDQVVEAALAAPRGRVRA